MRDDPQTLAIEMAVALAAWAASAGILDSGAPNEGDYWDRDFMGEMDD